MKDMLLKCRACKGAWEQGCSERDWDNASKELDSRNISQIIAHLGYKKCPHCKSKDVMHDKFILTLTFLDKTPKTVGTLAEHNSKKLGIYGKQAAEQAKEEDKKELKKISPKAKSVRQRKGDYKSYWPKLSKDAIKKIDIKEYINSPEPPKEM
jgi:hypothetical protein